MYLLTPIQEAPTKIVAYTYEADLHCVSCAMERFGPGSTDSTDNEGNPVHAVFDTDEIEDPDAGCGTCAEPLDG